MNPGEEPALTSLVLSKSVPESSSLHCYTKAIISIGEGKIHWQCRAGLPLSAGAFIYISLKTFQKPILSLLVVLTGRLSDRKDNYELLSVGVTERRDDREVPSFSEGQTEIICCPLNKKGSGGELFNLIWDHKPHNSIKFIIFSNQRSSLIPRFIL